MHCNSLDILVHCNSLVHWDILVHWYSLVQRHWCRAIKGFEALKMKDKRRQADKLENAIQLQLRSRFYSVL